MKKLLRNIINKAWSYDAYQTKVYELFDQGKTTGMNHSVAIDRKSVV